MPNLAEFTVPALVPARHRGGLADLVFDNAETHPHAVAFSRKHHGSWAEITTRQFRDEVVAVAKGLVAAGIQQGDRVALLANTRYEWTLIDFALWTIGAQPVPIYTTSSAEQVQWILRDSEAVGVIVETAAHEETVRSVHGELPALTHLWRIDPADDTDPGGVTRLATLGADVEEAEVDARRAQVSPADIATIIYTSGTTGRPKGCMLTHGNFFAEVDNGVALLADLFTGDGGEPPATLLFLPLAHVFGRMVQVACVAARTRMGHAPSVKNLLEDLAEFRPTFVLAVPYVFEKIYNTSRRQAHVAGKARVFDAAAATAIAYSEATLAGGAGPLLRLKHALFDRVVYTRLRAALGGRVRYAISGGAALGDRLTHFYRGTGITVLEGYGLTETTAACAINTPGALRIGTVGRPAPDTTIRISETGEILVKGGTVFAGYWRNETATAEVFTDDWFATGDLGELDPDGYLRITGRKKELLITSGGKNVSPAVIEDRIRAHPLVGQCMVIGDSRPYVAALVTIEPEFFTHWKAEHGKPAEVGVADLTEDPDLIATVQEAVNEGNKAVSRAESVRRFRILSVDFTPENGYLTPSLKLKRAMIGKALAEEIEALYR